ncbi:hypothetical protein [Roseomonas populi]|uniref:Uncharacterized protein n=1 Tax=Roseomonas populi TaxID=3121582 RepID=A0ABT1X7M9_9PROT|nr:hypothetical protein [Roseomonas pecuniae]MCR0983403.1 hypothetical protein [Roseomonas pecuniae]
MPHKQDDILDRLRQEMQRCLTGAPINGEVVGQLELRAELAASLSRHLGPPDEEG